jgi:peptide-methionine (R)-S-oxide reductase
MSNPAAVPVTVSRRKALAGLAATAALAPLIGACGGSEAEARAKAQSFPIARSEAEWRKLLTPAQYFVLRAHGTEPPFTSPLDREKRRGTFVCAADNNPLFASSTKFDSGTGWPSFTKPLRRAIGTSRDVSLGMVRTEVHCAQCGGHLGHVFDDGPMPTGKRYCINGDAMKFQPD